MKPVDPEKLARLPKWAQDHFTAMHAHIDSLNNEIDAYGWQDEKPKTELCLRRSKHRGDDSTIWEYLPLDKWVDCCHIGGVHLSAGRTHYGDEVRYHAEVRCENGTICITPYASNVARVREEQY